MKKSKKPQKKAIRKADKLSQLGDKIKQNNIKKIKKYTTNKAKQQTKLSNKL